MLCLPVAAGTDEPSAPQRVTLINPAAVDQDDLTIWRDAGQPSRSLVVASDKSAGKLFVYDFAGNLRQTLSMPKPGNIDLRCDVRVGDRRIDIVAVNQRDQGTGLRLFRLDRETRHLLSLGDLLPTAPNYGGCLFHDRRQERLYFICTAEDGACRQYEISFEAGDETPRLREVRTWQIGKCEGAVADDERGLLFITEETRGVWMLGARSEDPAPGELIARVGDHGLTGDLEGVALTGGPEPWLIVSDQGRGKFVAFTAEREARYLGEFAVPGVKETDGLELSLGNFGDAFAVGVFGCHNGAAKPCPIVLTPWTDVKNQLRRAE